MANGTAKTPDFRKPLAGQLKALPYDEGVNNLSSNKTFNLYERGNKLYLRHIAPVVQWIELWFPVP
jgi:hypothetical protein